MKLLPMVGEQAADPIAYTDTLLQTIGREEQHLIALLQAIQERFRYLPEEALRHIAANSEIPGSDIEGVASFYTQFRRNPVGRHIVKVCHGTACHVKGAPFIEDALRRHLGLKEGEVTDAEGRFTIERVACVGCCSIAPVVQIEGASYGHLTSESAPQSLQAFLQSLEGKQSKGTSWKGAGAAEIRIATDSCCAACGAAEVKNALEDAAKRFRFPGRVRTVSCTGICHLMPMAEVVTPDGRATRFTNLKPEDADRLVRDETGFFRKISASLLDLLVEPATTQLPVPVRDARDPHLCAFLGPQKHISMEEGGSLTPLDLDGYLAHGGFSALDQIRAENDPAKVVQTVLDSGLRGRGGAGFPTGRKWDIVRKAKGDTKYLICNGDEGDPGAFMDRMLLESFPFRVLEGMAIASFAMGIGEGVLYIRAEYPQAVANIKTAIGMLEERGILNGLKLKVVQGAGAFVCGEETALIASIEGRRGTPRPRPPFPAESGLWDKPTCVNNVETYSMIPWILRNGAAAFAEIGTEKSKGTKVFALAGAVKRGGLIEVPMGTTIRQIVEEIGGGVADGRTFKAVLIGGPSGGCVPASLAETPVDYEALQSVGAITGSGGLVVLDDRSCMVDAARFFMSFTQDESCGKCTMCRVGTRRMKEILDRLCEGKGKKGDLEALEDLAQAITVGSLCGLGQTAPNPVLSTLRHFKAEYEAHLEGHCPAGRCTKLVHYSINDQCIGCTKCAQVCPVSAIAMRPHELHMVDDELCIRCGLCRDVCTEEAVNVG